MARPIDPKKREQIVAAARSLFQEKGYAQTRMAEIAQCAGIAAGTLYLYFDSKETLAQALGDDYIKRLSEALIPYLQHPDPARAIADSIHIALTFHERERDQLRLLGLNLGLGIGRQRTPGQVELYEMLAGALQARIDRREIVAYDPQVLAELLGGLFEWVSQQILINGEGERARYEESLVRLMQRALLPDRGAGTAGEPTAAGEQEDPAQGVI